MPVGVPFCDTVLDHVLLKRGQTQSREVHIIQRDYSHDVAQVLIEYDDSTHPQYAFGTAAALVWGYVGGKTNIFTGYVHHVEPRATHDNTRTMLVYLTSASSSMKQSSTKVYVNATVASVVREIANRYKFSSVVPFGIKRKFSRLPQLNRSDWDMLVWLTQQCGLSLTCDKTTIYVQKRNIHPQGATQFSLVRGQEVQQNAVYTASQRDGMNPFNSHDILTAAGVSDGGSTINRTSYGSRADLVPRLVSSNVDRAVVSTVDAQQQINAQLSMDKFHITGDAVISGDAGVRPASTIELLNVDSKTNGFWWVNEVEHVITLTDYRMKVKLGRESLPQPKRVSYPVSWSGNPVISGDPGVLNSISALPDTVFISQDKRSAIEPLTVSAFSGLQSSLTGTGSPARDLAAMQTPTPSRRRGVSSSEGDKSPVPRLNGWRSSSSKLTFHRGG